MVKVKKLELWDAVLNMAKATFGESKDLKYTAAFMMQYSLRNDLSKERRKVLRKYAKKVWDEE